VDVEKIDALPGEQIRLGEVLIIGDGGEVTCGQPTIPGAAVIATVGTTAKGKKVIIYKYKAKVRYHRKKGHRQPLTRITVDEIVKPGQED
jgi:large subunit ribosomal protein L21